MPDISAIPNAYVSDGEIIAWLEEKSNDQYSELDGMMFTSNDRSNLMQQLTSLQADVDAGKPTDQVLGEMQTIQEQYAGTSLGPEVDKLLLPMEAKIAPLVASDPNSDTITQLTSDIQNSSLSDDEKSTLTGQLTSAVPYLAATVDAMGAFSGVSAQLKGEVDKLGRIDQLDLITIQSLVSDARQTDQLGSNIISSRDQASSAIVGNIRG
jgi:hypothetical protein